jgi:hypothetical protein
VAAPPRVQVQPHVDGPRSGSAAHPPGMRAGRRAHQASFPIAVDEPRHVARSRSSRRSRRRQLLQGALPSPINTKSARAPVLAACAAARGLRGLMTAPAQRHRAIFRTPALVIRPQILTTGGRSPRGAPRSPRGPERGIEHAHASRGPQVRRHVQQPQGRVRLMIRALHPLEEVPAGRSMGIRRPEAAQPLQQAPSGNLESAAAPARPRVATQGTRGPKACCENFAPSTPEEPSPPRSTAPDVSNAASPRVPGRISRRARARHLRARIRRCRRPGSRTPRKDRSP